MARNRLTYLSVAIAGLLLLSPPLYRKLKTRYEIASYYARGDWAYHAAILNNGSSGSVILLGDSITRGFGSPDSIANHGISGDYTGGLIKRKDALAKLQPTHIFIMIGFNDIIMKVPMSEIKANYLELVEYILKECPHVKLYVQSTLPTSGLRGILTSNSDIIVRIMELNFFLSSLCKRKKITFIDLFPLFANKDGELKRELSTDGIHLNDAGYKIWRKEIAPFWRDRGVL